MHAGAGREARPGFYFRIECGNFPQLGKIRKLRYNFSR